MIMTMALRLGEVLLATGAITEQQLDEALRAQVMWGGRLGTNLVELGFITVDELSRAIGRQHNLPAALESHFDRAEPELQQKLPAQLAELHACVPLLRAGKRIVIASMAPLDDRAVALVAGQLDVNRHMIVQSVAAELRMRYQLEVVYKIARTPRFVRTRGTEDSAVFSLPELAPPRRSHRITHVEELEPVIPLEVEGAAQAPRDSRSERRAYLRTLADLLVTHSDKQSVLDQIERARKHTPPRPFAIGSTPLPKLELAVIADRLPEALADIELSRDRNELARRVVGAVARFIPETHSALLLVVRGNAAITELSFARDGSEVPALAVPIGDGGLVGSVMRRKSIRRGASGDLAPVDYLLLEQLGVQFGELVIAPLVIGEHVVGALVLATKQRAELASLQAITSATSSAFARMMRDAPSS
jgi:hypothetical protein